MPTVPKYERQVAERGAFQQNVTTQASPDDMGAAIGRGMGALAQGVGQAGQAFAQLKELEDVADAKNADNSLADWDRDAQYGEGGFMTLQGKAAIDGQKTYQENLRKRQQEISGGLAPGARQAFDRASQARIRSSLDQSVVHSANERKRYLNETSAARVGTFANDALAGYQNPALVTKNLAAGQAEIRQQAELNGWDAAKTEAAERDFISGVHKNVALRMAQSDPKAAQRYANENKSMLTGDAQADLDGLFRPLVEEEEAKGFADQYLNGGPQASVVGPIAGRTLGAAGPSRTHAFLKSRAPGKGDDAISDLDEGFATNLSTMMQSAPPEIADGLQLLSGSRSIQRQQELWDASDKSGKMVARPGGSKHNHGQAVDLMWNGKRLDKAPEYVRAWVHDNAGKFGMFFPMDYEAWHIEPIGSRARGAGPASAPTIAAATMGRVRANEFAADDLPPAAYGLLGALRSGESNHTYNVRFDGAAGATFQDFSDHPRVMADNPRDGTKSSAAGAYQFIGSTWDRAAGAVGAQDFSPANQDRAAWWLAGQDYKQRTGRDLTSDLASGRYGEVRKGLAGTWAALGSMSDAKFAAAVQASGSGVKTGISPGASLADPTAFLDTISNPNVRQATAQRIQAITALRDRQQKAQAEQFKTQAFSIVDGGQSPDTIPAEVRARLGREEMAGLWSYYKGRTERGQPETDERTLYDLQTMYAQDPASFGDLDLFKYRDKLDDKSWKEVTGWRQTALNDQRKAKEDGIGITAAFSQADAALEAIGISTAGKEGSEREEAARRRAEFNNQLAREMATFKDQEKKNPTQVDIQAMVNRMLLPVVIQSEKSIWNPTKTPWSSMSEGDPVPAFEAGPLGARGDGTSAKILMPYERIPPSDRIEVEIALESALGRKPSEEEVEAKYAAYLADIYKSN